MKENTSFIREIAPSAGDWDNVKKPSGNREHHKIDDHKAVKVTNKGEKDHANYDRGRV